MLRTLSIAVSALALAACQPATNKDAAGPDAPANAEAETGTNVLLAEWTGPYLSLIHI